MCLHSETPPLWLVREGRIQETVDLIVRAKWRCNDIVWIVCVSSWNRIPKRRAQQFKHETKGKRFPRSHKSNRLKTDIPPPTEIHNLGEQNKKKFGGGKHESGKYRAWTKNELYYRSVRMSFGEQQVQFGDHSQSDGGVASVICKTSREEKRNRPTLQIRAKSPGGEYKSVPLHCYKMMMNSLPKWCVRARLPTTKL